MLTDAGVDRALVEALRHGVLALRGEIRRMSLFAAPTPALAA